MKTLWTPWRMEHVQGVTEPRDGCLFEPEGSGPHAKDDLLLYRDQTCLCLLNRYPYSNGHLLVAPVRHIADLASLTVAERNALMQMVSISVAILDQVLQPDGMNVGLNLGAAAGAGIEDHLHFHIVPRWHGDHNFMTVLAEVRTIPEHLSTTFDTLLPEFQKHLNNPDKS